MPTLRPFRFGVICEQMQSAEEWITKARQVEDYGYATLLIRDHFIREPFGDQLAPLIALMAASNATRTLHVGSLVLDNDYRHPVILAKEAATLDLLSDGRFELGIGAGWLRAEYEQAGADIESRVASRPYGMRDFVVRDPDGHRFTLGRGEDRLREVAELYGMQPDEISVDPAWLSHQPR